MADSLTSTARKGQKRQAPGEQTQRGQALPVLLPLPLGGAYHYLPPEGVIPPPGTLVVVPLGPREVLGVVWDEGEDVPEIAPEKLRRIVAVVDHPPFDAQRRAFIDWVARYTLAAPGAVLRMALHRSILEPERQIFGLKRSAQSLEGQRITPQRQRVLDLLAEGPAWTSADVQNRAGVSAGVIKGLLEQGLLVKVALPKGARFQAPDPDFAPAKLEPAQKQAVDDLRAAIPKGYQAFLLDGVTGSGKTEVYFEAIARALEGGRQVLVMLPEIALSAQWLERFRARFGVLPALWHSEVAPPRRRDTWRAVARGEARVVVGARSALFLPFQDLGLIIVDEEHDPSYKQDDGVTYHARDMAVARAHLGGFPVILASATPSLESELNVRRGRYARLLLPERHAKAKPPAVELIDLRKDKSAGAASQALASQSWLSPKLRAAVAETLAADQQVLLFLNRRGYAPLTLCRACGHRLQCPNCAAWLVEHRLVRRLQCHHCGFHTAPPKTCPACGAEDQMAACGPGVERLAEEVRALFPQARLGLMSSDTLTGPSAAHSMVEAIQNHELDLLIGTQVVAKGHHFPLLTLVGVVDADLSLYGGDLRAAERSFHLLHQVAGRAGREKLPGRVMLQTSEPDHPVMRALVSGDREAFYDAELKARESAGQPPYGRLAAIHLSDPDPRRLDDFAAQLARVIPQTDGVRVLGPAPSPIALLRGRHRRRFLVQTRVDISIQGFLRAWLGDKVPPGQLRLRIDIDPHGFM